MQEERLYIKNDSLIIEGLLHKASGERCVIICHPHSLMGGSMYNNVVESMQEFFSAEGYSTFRFNFRGVGASTGTYQEGKGEAKDIIAVCKYLREYGFSELLFAGYSFGAWVGSMVIGETDPLFSFSVFVSPPINYFNFSWERLKNKIDLIITGDHDPFCDVRVLIRNAGKINLPVEIISGADHFYRADEDTLKQALSRNVVK